MQISMKHFNTKIVFNRNPDENMGPDLCPKALTFKDRHVTFHGNIRSMITKIRLKSFDIM